MSPNKPVASIGLGSLAAVGALYLDPARAAVGPLPAEGLLFPADVRFVIGVDVKRLTSSPLYRRFKAQARPEPAPAAAALTADYPAPETIEVHSRRIACDGVGGALGHPRVWLEMGDAGFVECPYCDRRFVLAPGAEGPEDERLAPGVYEGPHGH